MKTVGDRHRRHLFDHRRILYDEGGEETNGNVNILSDITPASVRTGQGSSGFGAEPWSGILN